MYVFIFFLFFFSTGLHANSDFTKRVQGYLRPQSHSHFRHDHLFFLKQQYYSTYTYLTADILSKNYEVKPSFAKGFVKAKYSQNSLSLFFSQIKKGAKESIFFKNWQNKKDNQEIVFAKPIKRKFKDRFGIDSAYFFNQKENNRSYLYAAYDIESLLERTTGHFVDTYSSDKTIPLWIQKTLAYSLYTAMQYPVYHEWGHLTRAQALGIKSYMIMPNFSNDTKTDNFFLFSMSRITPFFSASPYTSYQDISAWYQDLSEEERTNKWMNWQMILSGAGINNQSDYADFCDEQLFLNHNISLFRGVSALLHRSASLYYPDNLSDITSLKGYYKFENTSPLHEAGLWSILSGTNLSILKSLIKGDPVVTPLTYKGFLIPNQTNYFSSYGLSRKWSSGYSANDDFAFLLSFEYVENGKPFQEYMMGFRYQKNDYTTLSKTYLSGTGFVNHELHVEKKLADTWAVSGYFALWDSRSLVGQRHSLNLRETTSYQLGLKFSYLY